MMRYGFRKAVSAMFLAKYDGLREHLPKNLWPLEAQTGFGILAMTSFEFDDTEVGPYGELVLSVIVMPWVAPGEPFPDAAYYPFVLATTTERSRIHAAERWHLPVYERCITTTFHETPTHRSVAVTDGDDPVLRLEVGRVGVEASDRKYQCFSGKNELYRGVIGISGPMDEHEEELGSLELSDHPLGRTLAALIEEDRPFREQSMDAGMKTYSDLVPHVGVRR